MENTSLYLVPTPIGNMEDITLRALRILNEVDVILAEDTRTSGKLLKHHEIIKPLQSYHIFNEHQTAEKLVSRMQEGETFALISDAGTPSISDPGFLLVRETFTADFISKFFIFFFTLAQTHTGIFFYRKINWNSVLQALLILLGMGFQKVH